jgi:hypothetical protein
MGMAITRSAFNAQTISDQKRLARGELWIAARTRLRGRDFAHQLKWNVLVVSGPCPNEETNCIRELMPKATITSVDCVAAHTEAAMLAKVDTAVTADLFAYVRGERFNEPPAKIQKHAPFDAIFLDLTGPVDDALATAVSVYSRSLTPRGILMLTFCYGRDVVEAYMERWKKRPPANQEECVARLESIDAIPEEIKARLYVALGKKARYLDTCIQYQGNVMPMFSCLMKMERILPPPNFIKLIDTDYAEAVTQESIGKVYACTDDRILTMRRSAAARKAVHTRQIREENSNSDLSFKRASLKNR